MTIQYQSDFESTTLGATPTGWTALSGAFVVQNSAGGALPVSGTQATLTQSADGNVALLTGIAALASGEFTSAHKVYIASNDIAINHHILRSDSTFANGYRIAIVYSGGNYTAVLLKMVSGAATNLGGGTGTPFAVTNGDTVYMATKISGTTIELRLWKGGGSRPSAATYSWTDSAISAAGLFGFMSATGMTGKGPSSDDVTVDDLQSGGTNGTATGATLTGTGTISGGAASGGTSVTFSTLPLKNNTGALLTGETGVTLNLYNTSTGALVLRKTGLTSDASTAVVSFTVTDGSLASGTYAYEPVLSGGRRRLPTKATS